MKFGPVIQEEEAIPPAHMSSKTFAIIEHLRELEIGNARCITEENLDTTRKLVYRAGDHLGYKFVTRKMTNGLKVWRIE